MQGTTTRYVLGFDAECSFCVEVAEEIRDRFGEHLELRDLREVEMAEWRREALSENPAWTPVLVKISGENVSLYSGYRLGLALAWRLGPVVTWRLAKALGEMQGCEEANEKNTSPLLTRSQFVSGLLKASAGAALAFSVLSMRPDNAEASLCCMYACEFCYNQCGRRCRSCDCVKRCKEGYNCYRCNCRCKARYC